MTDKHLEKALPITTSQSPLIRNDQAEGLGSFFQKNGANNGRLIATRDRVTYTFLFAGEAVAIHFDIGKRELFIKGHRLMDLETKPETIELLSRFKQALAAEPETRDTLVKLDSVLSNLANRM